jgi:hypothetical protein
VDYFSADQRFVAHSSLDPNMTTAVDLKSGAALWSIPHWFREGALASDGVHFIATLGGSNLVPRDFHPPDLPMLQFYESGQLIATVTLGELISQEALGKFETISHYAWGSFLGLDAEDHYWVETSLRDEFIFDVRGHLIKKRDGAARLGLSPPAPSRVATWWPAETLLIIAIAFGALLVVRRLTRRRGGHNSGSGENSV